MGTEKNVDWYDDWYSQHGAKAPYRYSIYRLWKNAARWVMAHRKRGSVTDLGCGYAPVGRILFDNGYRGHYIGVDFSKNAIDVSGQILSAKQGDAKRAGPCNFSLYIDDIANYQVTTPLCILCEVLEHIDEDILVLQKIPSGTYVWASVPSFDSESHVRHFPSMGSVATRFEDTLLIRNIRRWDMEERFFFTFVGERR